MSHSFTTLVVGAVLNCWGLGALCQSYWSDGRQIPLVIDSSLITMKFEPSTSPEQQRSIIEGTGYLSNAVLDAPLIHGFVACSLKTNIDFATAKANLAQRGQRRLFNSVNTSGHST